MYIKYQTNSLNEIVYLHILIQFNFMRHFLKIQLRVKLLINLTHLSSFIMIHILLANN